MLKLSSNPYQSAVNTRQTQWNAKLQELTGVKDGLGLGLDEPIVDTVAALQVNGFPTRQSCGGHVTRGCATPWVDIHAASVPALLFSKYPSYCGYTTRYNQEEQAFQQVADQHGLMLDQMMARKSPAMDEYRREALTLASKNGETSEYKQWVLDNQQLCQKFKTVVMEYNASHQVEPENQIKIKPSVDSSIRIFTGSREDLDIGQKCTPEELEIRAEHLEPSRAAMQDFGAYLKQRFLNNGPAVA